jgi:hypothetical protein
MSSLSSIAISVQVNNEPFVRSLTATLLDTTTPLSGIAISNTNILWEIPDTVNAFDLSGNRYNEVSAQPAYLFNTLVLYFSANTYDYRTSFYTLCSFTILCSSFPEVGPIGQTNYKHNFDTFPNIDIDLFVNYENTKVNTLFYRLTSNDPYNAVIELGGRSIEFLTPFSGYHFSKIYINNVEQTETNFITDFDVTTPVLCTIRLELSAASSPFAYLSARRTWFTPHTVSKSITAQFVPYFLGQADFIAYPNMFFKDRVTQVNLTNTNYTLSPGLSFFGEGHTETINLVGSPLFNVNYIWKVGTPTYQFPVSKTSFYTAFTQITSQIGNYPRLPISLQLTDNLFLSTSPTFYFDDNVGVPIYYPFYKSTVSIYNEELPTNNRYRESIHVLPYTPLEYIFDSGAPNPVYLPIDKSNLAFTGTFKVALSTPQELNECYDKYGLAWTWTNFENCTAAIYPRSLSSWGTVECSGVYPKKWRNEGVLSADLFLVSPASCTGSNIVWNLSSVNWSVTTTNSITSIPLEEYYYTLKFDKLGLTPFTVNEFNDNFVTLSVERSATCVINAPPYDWQFKTVTLKDSEVISVPSLIKFTLFTPNKYYLTKTPILFENISNNFEALTALYIDFGENNTTYLTGSDIYNNFTVTYSSVGFKTINAIGYLQNNQSPINFTLPDIVYVTDEYHEVVPEKYQIFETSINLPWKSQPYIGINEIAVDDNFNSCIKKFYDNLNYLENKGKVYTPNYTNFYGWLGQDIVIGVEPCPVWTWENLDCTTQILREPVTWVDVFSADPLSFEESGYYVNCGIWEQHYCDTSKGNPNCVEKYCTEWMWKLRKSINAEEPITWKQTKSRSEYPKKWRYEPCEDYPLIVCSEKNWKLDLPGIDDTYENINCVTEGSCSWKGAVSKNNIIYAALKTQIRILSSDYTAKYFNLLNNIDGVTPFINIQNLSIDSTGNIYVLDGDLAKVACINYTLDTPRKNWNILTTWGGFGGPDAKKKFLNPTDIHVDQYDSVWVCDSGNNCIKQFTGGGAWLNTIKDNEFENDKLLSLCVDSQEQLHVLLSSGTIRVYTYKGEFIFKYEANEYLDTPTRINTNNNREIIYCVNNNKVIKYFRTGVFAGYLLDQIPCVTNINSVFHDEFCNVLVTSNDKIVKALDLMRLSTFKTNLPSTYWSLDDLLINKEEYVQDWVYNRSLQRLWDNIEMFRNSLFYNKEQGYCQEYKPLKYQKNEIFIGQNEIVTNTVINRCFKYLWENFSILLDYFNSPCTTPTPTQTPTPSPTPTRTARLRVTLTPTQTPTPTPTPIIVPTPTPTTTIVAGDDFATVIRGTTLTGSLTSNDFNLDN